MRFILKYRITASILYFVLQGIYVVTKPSFSKVAESELAAWIALILLLIFWLIVFIDILKNKLYSKTFWILAMIIMPFLTPVFYLFQRERLLRLQQNRFPQGK